LSLQVQIPGYSALAITVVAVYGVDGTLARHPGKSRITFI
jgi:hypothetical protein